MQFLWSPLLWSLALVPLLVALYVWLQTRRRKYAVRYTSLTLIKPALTSYSRLRRYLPPTLFFLALALMLIGLARPVALVRTPVQEGTIILALDSSQSMSTRDMDPNRFEAARAAARAFIDKRVGGGADIGVVTFAANAAIVQMPTTKSSELQSAIDTLFLQRGTAIGEGILTSMDAIAMANGGDAPAPNVNSSLDLPREPLLPKVAPGTWIPAIIVLLTDGQNRNGIDPLEAAQMAADRGVRVYTVGIGSRDPVVLPNSFGGGATFGNNGGRFNQELDEDALRAIADKTGGEYFYAANSAELEKIYSNLGLNLVLKLEKVELTVWLTAGATALLLLALALSMVWNSFTA